VLYGGDVDPRTRRIVTLVVLFGLIAMTLGAAVFGLV
jgi:hypothetical protein